MWQVEFWAEIIHPEHRHLQVRNFQEKLINRKKIPHECFESQFVASKVNAAWLINIRSGSKIGTSRK